MSLLYVNESGVTIGISENRCKVQYKDGMTKEIPLESLESISVLGNAQISTQCMKTCLQRGIPVAFFSKGGKYFGRLQSTSHVNAERQRLQCALYEDQFSIEFSRRIIMAKINNQIIVLRRYGRSGGIEVDKYTKTMLQCKQSIERANSIEEIMGYEGYAARAYFSGLAEVIEPEFKFNGRSRQPPLDEFNSMISLGYSILMNVLYSCIEMKGLNPYFGFMHRDKEKHPTLASDLMEEWRAVIVDSTALSLVNGHEIHKEDFYYDMENPGCFLTRNGLKTFVNKLENKLITKVKYFTSVPFSVSFRYGISLQIDTLINAMESRDATIYRPIEIR